MSKQKECSKSKILLKIEQLANMPKSAWMGADREWVVGMCADNNIPINPLCPDCYHDAVIQLYGIYKPKGTAKQAGGYELREGLNVMYHANNRVYHVCEATLTEKNAKAWLKAGLPRRFFSKLPNE